MKTDKAIPYGQYNEHGIFLAIAGNARRKMFKLFMELASPDETHRVLDVGVTPDNEPEGNNYFEKMYPYTQNITMCSIEDASDLENVFPGAKFLQNTPGQKLPFDDKQFDIVFCSAVLEHVGSHASQQEFLNELLRVGKHIFLTTPNRWYPIELHTVLPIIHWLPQNMHQRILRMLGMKFYAETQNLNLLTKKRLLSLIPPQRTRSAQIYFNKLFGLSSNIILYI